MQLQKDVLIAGGVVVVCVALVVVALVATGKKDQPADLASSSAATDSYNSSSTSYDGTSFGTPGALTSTTGAPPVDAFGATPPSSGGLPPLDSSYGGSPSGSPFGSTAGTPAPAGSAFDTGMGQPPVAGSSNLGGPAFGGSAMDPVSGTSTGSSEAAPVVGSSTSSAGGGTHTVAKGETLGDISATHYGTTKHWKKIVEANPGLDPARLKIGQVLQIPAVETSAAATATVAGGAGTHTVAKGESYYTIAKKVLGSSSRWREIERLNGIPAESLKVGTVIKVPTKEQGGASTGTGGPAGGGKTHIVSKGETLGDISKEYFGTTTKWKLIVEANPGVRPENLKVGQSLVIPDAPASTGSTAAANVGGNAYTVKAGDTLESIAAATLGKKSAWKQIVEANPGLKPTALRVGQSIQIPGGSVSAPAPVAPAPAGLDSGFGPAPAPGVEAAPVPAPAPQPTFQDDPFYSPYDVQPAAAGSGASRI